MDERPDGGGRALTRRVWSVGRRLARMGRQVIATAALLAVICACGGRPAASEGPAAVVVDFGDGRVLMRTAAAPTGGLSGRDLLAATDLAVVEKNGFICRIGDVGCELAECPCLGAYWSYWHWQDGAWAYAVTGAAGYSVARGAVDAWRWNADDAAPTPIDPALVFDPSRLMPALPITTAIPGGLGLQVDFEGDVNNNATAVAVCTAPTGDVQRLPLARQEGSFSGTLAGAASPGTWQVEFTYEDPDGINGSASWPLLFERP